MKHNCNNCAYTQLLSSPEVRHTHLFCTTHVEVVNNSMGCESHKNQSLKDTKYRYDLLIRDGILPDIIFACETLKSATDIIPNLPKTF